MGFEIDLIFKIAAIGILLAVIHSLLKQAGKEEAGWLATLAGVAIVLVIVVRLVGNVFTTVQDVFRL